MISGCAPGERVTVRATSELQGTLLEAEAAFEARPDGTVDVRTQASVAGTFSGVDPFGLWWSGVPKGPAPAPIDQPHVVPTRLAVDASTGRTEVLLERRLAAEGVVEVDVSGDGFRGSYFRPPGLGPFPGLVAFGGSAGGLGPAAAWAPVLASRGVATLAIGFFRMSGLPTALVEIEVEVVERAIRYLQATGDVTGDRVAVMGQSRGSELALLAASASPSLVDRVVVFSASGVVWCGLDDDGHVDRSAWTLRGEPVPFLGRGLPQPPRSGDEPFRLTTLYGAALDDSLAVSAAEIPIEHVDGPILAVSGEDDQLWPSVQLIEIGRRRAHERGLAHDFAHLRYPSAGHTGPGVPGLPSATETRHPLGGFHLAFGGTSAGNADARTQSWPRVVSFLGGHC